MGYSEEFGRELSTRKRGLDQEPPAETTQFGKIYDKKDGYLLTTRGNPFGNIVKDGKKVILHSATGNDFDVPILKQIKVDSTWTSPDAMVAMAKVNKHMDNLECYACHASWVPQCYGCHVNVDYSLDENGKMPMRTDWISSANSRTSDGQTSESRIGDKGVMSPGKVKEGRSYLRWEEPVLGINGEGRVTPLMPGCQVVYTVKGRDGNTIAHNVIGNSEDEAQQLNQEVIPLAIDMAPVQPHSAQRKARSCESCHNNAKAMGYGIAGGVFNSNYAEAIVEDLKDQKTGKPIPANFKIQIQKIANLTFDWSTIVDGEGNQVQTVGTHWPMSRALNKEERAAMARTGLCMGCHRNMDNEKLWTTVSTEGSLTGEEHLELMNKMLEAYAKTKKK